MKKILLILVCLSFYFSANAQWRKVEKLEKDKTPNVKLAYWTNATFNYPGFVLGGEFMFRKRSVSIKNFERTKENYLAVDFSLFNQADLQRGIGFTTSWLKRTTYQHSGIFTQLNLGVGYVRDATVRPTTYVKNPDGSETTKSATKNYFLVKTFVGAGYDFMPKLNLPFKFYTQIGFAPFTSDFAWLFQFEQFTLDIGFVTSLSTFKKKQ
ncbi:MAG: hypothetical protein RL757_770 [Bacteroidota bacterium]|jgi:hypothetical protein